MLRIREKQIAALSDYMMEQFIQRMAEHVRSEFPEQVDQLTSEQVHDTIVSLVVNAKSYGISLEGNLETFIDSAVVYGPDFESTPWITEILEDPAFSETEKLDEISVGMALAAG